MSVCGNVVVAGVRCAERSRTLRECVKDDIDELCLHPVQGYVEKAHIGENV